MSDEHPTHVTATDARGAAKTGMMRYVLGTSLALILIVFAVLLFVWR